VSDQYITSEDHLPADTDGEISLQVTDQETKHIFTTRARIARDAAELDDPDPLTILRGPTRTARSSGTSRSSRPTSPSPPSTRRRWKPVSSGAARDRTC